MSPDQEICVSFLTLLLIENLVLSTLSAWWRWEWSVMQNISSWHRLVVLIIKVLPVTMGVFHPRVLGTCTQMNDHFQIRSPWPLSFQWNCDSCSLGKIYKSVSLWTKMNMRLPQTYNLLSQMVAFWHQPVQWDMTQVQTVHGVKWTILAQEWEAIPVEEP